MSGIALDRYNAVSISKNKDILPTIITILGIDLFAMTMAIPYSLNIKVRKLKRVET